MITPTITSLDGTGNPAGDGCTASYETAGTDTNPRYGDYYFEYFFLRAKEGKGWRFDHFEYTQTDTVNGITHQIYDARGSKDGDGEYVFPKPDTPHTSSYWQYLSEGHWYFADWGGLLEEDKITRCVAVFAKKEGSGKILHNNVGLILHGRNGTILYDD